MDFKQSYIEYFKYLILSFVITGLGCFVGDNFMGDMLHGVSIFVPVLVVIGLLIAVNCTKGVVKKILATIFFFVEGLMLSPVLAMYAETTLIYAVILTVITCTVFAVLGYVIKRDLSFLHNILLIILVAVIIYMVVGFFIPLVPIDGIILVVFCGLVVVDFNRFTKMAKAEALDSDRIIEEVIDMYLNILNIFLSILSIFGDD